MTVKNPWFLTGCWWQALITHNVGLSIKLSESPYDLKTIFSQQAVPEREEEEEKTSISFLFSFLAYVL